MGEIADTLSSIISASLFAINGVGGNGSDSAPLVNFGALIGQGSLPNVVTSALLLLLVTPAPLRVLQGRLDSAKSEATAAAPPPAVSETAPPPSEQAIPV